jgi:hypothetical protein
MLTDKLDTRGNAKLLWVKKDEGVHNDFRDAIRYGLALGALIVESGGVHDVATRTTQDVGHEGRAFVRQPQEGSSGGWVRRRTS